MNRQMESGASWLEMSQNTTVGTDYAGEYRREACNDAGLGKPVAKCDIIAFCDTPKSSLVPCAMTNKL